MLGGEPIEEIIMRSMVKSYVRKAFDLIGDLAENVTFINNNSSGFDYATGLPIDSGATQHTFKAVRIEKTMQNGNINVTKLLLMTEQFALAGIADIDVFDKVVVRGEVLNVIHSPTESMRNKDNGYTVTVYASAEVA
jgi:hypothetical protein